jgi:hypothetical protein
MTTKFDITYAGIGSRETPTDVLKVMTIFARYAYTSKRLLVTGGAKGADSAFMAGVTDPNGMKVYRAEDATKGAIALASKYHPNWAACSEYVKKLHGRNMMILLGHDLSTPVNYVVCWTPNGAIVGGTGQALRAANEHNISVYNLYNSSIMEIVTEQIKRWKNDFNQSS